MSQLEDNEGRSRVSIRKGRIYQVLPLKGFFLLQVPSFLITQVRRMNEATMLLKKQLPSMKKLLRRKTLDREVRASVGQTHSRAVASRRLLKGGLRQYTTQILWQVPINRALGSSCWAELSALGLKSLK